MWNATVYATGLGFTVGAVLGVAIGFGYAVFLVKEVQKPLGGESVGVAEGMYSKKSDPS